MRSKSISKSTTGVLDDLSVFAVVAEHASFVEASRRLSIPTSSVSRAVARIEEQLDVQLLRRTSRRVTLTDEGRQLHQQARAHIEGLQEALATLVDQHPEPSGVVRVTAPAYTGATRVTDALATFAVAHPKITIELDATNAFRDLLQDGFDFGIRVGPLQNPDFVSRRIWRGSFGLFASPAFAQHLLAGRAQISRADLENGPCVVLRPSVTWRFAGTRGEIVNVTPNARFSVNDPRAALNAAALGVGIALSPVDAAARSSGELVQLSTDFGEPEAIDLYVVYPTRRLLPQRVRLAIDWLGDPTRWR
jgi:DNA-binding transcriptional LysR family regulator